jgi:hypothetical protein
LTIAIASTRSGDRHIGGPAPVVFEAYARSEVTTTADDEARLVASLRLGDERAFTEIVDRYGSAMYRVARAYVGSDDLAGDVLQEAWLVALRSIQTFEGRSTLRTWLIGIAVNVARSRRRREARGSAFSVLLSALAERRSSPTSTPHDFRDALETIRVRGACLRPRGAIVRRRSCSAKNYSAKCGRRSRRFPRRTEL